MLTTFLDSLGIEHEDGEVEDLPDELDKDKLNAAINALLAKYPSAEVTLYLILFTQQRPEGWPELQEILDNDARLSLDGSAPEPTATEEPSTSVESEEADVTESDSTS